MLELLQPNGMQNYKSKARRVTMMPRRGVPLNHQINTFL